MIEDPFLIAFFCTVRRFAFFKLPTTSIFKRAPQRYARGLHPITPRTGALGTPGLRQHGGEFLSSLPLFVTPAFSKSAVPSARRACTVFVSPSAQSGMNPGPPMFLLAGAGGSLGLRVSSSFGVFRKIAMGNEQRAMGSEPGKNRPLTCLVTGLNCTDIHSA